MASLNTPGVQSGNNNNPVVNSVVNSQQLYECINRLNAWLEKNNYKGYDTFDCFNAKFLRPLTFETKYLRMALQQGIRRFPINLRPVLGMKKVDRPRGWHSLQKVFCACLRQPETPFSAIRRIWR